MHGDCDTMRPRMLCQCIRGNHKSKTLLVWLERNRSCDLDRWSLLPLVRYVPSLVVRISCPFYNLFGVLGGDVMVCWGIASFLSDRERAQMGFRFIFQFPIGMTFRVGTLDSPPPSPPLDVSGSGLAPQPPPAKAARGRGDSSPR